VVKIMMSQIVKRGKWKKMIQLIKKQLKVANRKGKKIRRFSEHG
jgi:hypothetical protein